MKIGVKLVVEIDLVDFDYLGLPDVYQDEGNCNNYVFGDETHASMRDWTRWSPESTNKLYDSNK